MPEIIPPFKNISAVELISMTRYVGGLDYWPVPLRGHFPRKTDVRPAPHELNQSWTELRESSNLREYFRKLEAMQPFADALNQFRSETDSTISKEIRFFNIVLNSMHIYLIELADPSFTGIGGAIEKQKAIKTTRKLLGLIRGGLHFGTQGINDNYRLTVDLEEFLYFLENSDTVRRDDRHLERRFLKRIIYEFLIAYSQPLPKTLFCLYFLIWFRSKDTDDDTITRSITGYITEVRAEMERAKHPPVGTWYSERS